VNPSLVVHTRRLDELFAPRAFEFMFEADADGKCRLHPHALELGREMIEANRRNRPLAEWLARKQLKELENKQKDAS
jgi:hypothetical protein